MNIQLSNADQVGIVVRDLDAFLQSLEDLLGIRGFEVIEYPDDSREAQITYRANPAAYRPKLAFMKVGNLEVELSQPLEGESAFQEFLDERGPGLHHIRFTEREFDQISAALMDRGIQRMATGNGVHGPTKWAYFDTAELLQGLLIEIKKPSDNQRA